MTLEGVPKAMVIRPGYVALLYTLYALLALFILAGSIPPFQSPDEAAHVLRADQISHFAVMPRRLPGGGGGGLADAGVSELNGLFANLPFHRERKVTRAMYASVGWGAPVLTGFPNTVVYPPFFYLPAASMMALARVLDLSVLHAVLAARIATGLATIATGAIAIAIAGNAAIWFFMVLLLPMSMALGAAVTQDGPMLASTALAVSLCLHMRRHEPGYSRAAFALLCVLLALIGMARPPYLAFCLMVGTTRVPRRRQILGAVSIALCVAGWSTYNTSYIELPHWRSGAVNPAAQLGSLLRHPENWWQLIAGSFAHSGSEWLQGFVGCLGWLDVDLPLSYHYVARISLLLGLIAAWLSGAGPVRMIDVAVTLIAILVAWIGVMLVEYLTFTSLGASWVLGVQGRYALAPALLLGGAIGRPSAAQTHVPSVLTALVLTAPIPAIAVTVHALLFRYYL